jgi:diacylglycerol O-acyltransferase / wax synthase
MQRLSGPDAAFLYGETRSWHMHVSSVLMADPSTAPQGFSVERLRENTARRIELVPQFRWRVVEVPFGIDNPVFVEDPSFDIDYHVRHIAVPSPGGTRQLGELVGDLASYKLDRTRPLWEFWLIEGLEDGKVAVLAKVHHAIIDGVSGADLATVLLDLEPDPPEPPTPIRPEHGERIPTPPELLARAAISNMVMPWRTAQFGAQLVRQGRTFLRFRSGPKPPPAPFSAPRTSFNGRISPNRRFAYTTLPLSTMKSVKNAFGVKLNDVVLAVCAGALRRYLHSRDELPEQPLIAQVPVSTRTEDTKDDVGVQVAAMFASLETQVEDPVERLLAIHAGTTGAKEMQRAMAADKIMNLTDTMSPALVGLAARMYTGARLEDRTPPVFNLIISNVPGPPFDLYMAGARITGIYPMGPLLYGAGLNITVMSNATGVDFGVLTCRDVAPDPWLISDALSDSLQELVDAAEVATPADAEAQPAGA